MRLFLLLISTLVITVTLVLMGTSNTQLSGHLSQSITNMKGVSWQRLQGGELVDHDDHEFQANNVYTTRLGDDLLTTTWSTNEPLTSPMTYEGDYSFIMQAYSGYLFQSFDPLASYSLEGDYYEVFIDGAGGWVWLTDPDRVTLMSLSAIIRVQKQDGESIVMFPGEKVLLNKNDPSSTLVKVATNVGELEQVFTSDSNQVDTTAWDWFTNEVSEQFQTFALEYTPWTQLEKITQIDESVNTNRLLFFNKRKKALLEVENLFNKIQKLIKTRANCETGACRERDLANQLDDIDFLQPDLAEDFVKLMRAYYQRQYAHTIVSDEREADTLPFLMEHAFGQKTYELAKLFTPLISSHDRSLWIEDSPNQKELDKILMNASFDHLDIRDLEYVWHYFRSFIQSKQVASEYGLKLMHTFIDLGEMIRTHEGANLTDTQILMNSIEVLGSMQDQIQKGYFKKDGIIYIVKPELVSDADGELEFDIIDDFQDLFTQVKDIFESEENLIEIDIDKQDELTRILARLRWFECIFRNNPGYIKEPRICRGKLRK